DVQVVADREVFTLNGRHVPLVRLDQVLELPGRDDEDDDVLHIILTELGGELYGLACDHLLGKKEIVIKSLGELLSAVPCAAGATLLGDRCALILDVPAVIRRALEHTAPPPTAAPREAAAPTGAHILLVEDSDIVR